MGSSPRQGAKAAARRGGNPTSSVWEHAPPRSSLWGQLGTVLLFPEHDVWMSNGL